MSLLPKGVFNKMKILILCLTIFIGVIVLPSQEFTKIYVGEDSGMLTYGLQSGVNFSDEINYYGEIETFLQTGNPIYGGWAIDKVEYTLEFNIGQYTLGHKCQHYLLSGINQWDAENYISIQLELPAELTGGKGTRDK
jgi:hypothetical protein